eukprot:gnl/TRDRNA2_/TRDRNA2_162852_c6_seq4.p1 gnl/TRDRNA2_/TRDRNA2_162852_c6~~gnl/TRDRNA2_/TRDRNA2_162852_c6_seq4.p1  ORF type:complete len:172 (+),score=26.92 gnl/TRDRNA2_/TRDRNA2_162852_c6_seq4:90-605(+)
MRFDAVIIVFSCAVLGHGQELRGSNTRDAKGKLADRVLKKSWGTRRPALDSSMLGKAEGEGRRLSQKEHIPMDKWRHQKLDPDACALCLDVKGKGGQKLTKMPCCGSEVCVRCKDMMDELEYRQSQLPAGMSDIKDYRSSESLKDAWSLFDHAKATGVAFSPEDSLASRAR